MASKPRPRPPDPDRPMECDCKKTIAVRYTEIVGDTITHTSMCNDCPELQKRLHGRAYYEQSGLVTEGEGVIACGNCGTTLAAVKMGNPLGCSVCYDVFGDLILNELQSNKKLPSRINLNKKTLPIHIGKTPGEVQEISPGVRILALNEALTETLKREDYEQAAWLRDQIKALTEKQEKKDE